MRHLESSGLKNGRIVSLLSFCFIVLAQAAFTQTPCTYGPGGISGTPDCDFGGTGLVTTVVSGWSAGSDVVAQPDGKLVLAGHGHALGQEETRENNLYVLRYNPDGSLDDTFGVGGIATFGVTSQQDSEYAYGVALQEVAGETRVVVAGSAPLKSGGNPQYGVLVVRLTSTGQLDTSFGTNGRIQFGWASRGDSWGRDVVVQCDGRIVVAGKYGTDMGIARLTPNGALDSSFGTGGKTVVSLGKASGGDTIGGGFAVALQSFGDTQLSGCRAEQRVVVVGNRPTVSGSNTSRDMAIVRLLPNGAIDSSFGSNGRQFVDNARSVDYAYGVTVDAANRVVVAGYTQLGSSISTVDFAVVRLTPNGAFDSSFGTDGKVTTDVNEWLNDGQTVSVDSSGRIVLGGYSQNDGYSQVDFTAIRYLDDGSLDTSFGTGGISVVDFGMGSGTDLGGRLTVDLAGRIVMVGNADSSNRMAICALHP